MRDTLTLIVGVGMGCSMEQYLEWLQKRYLKNRVEIEGVLSAGNQLSKFMRRVVEKLPENNPCSIYFTAGMFVSLVALICGEEEAFDVVKKMFDI